MDQATMLQMLKVDLGLTTTAYDARLATLLTVAATEIAEEGITLSSASMQDGNLQVLYAAWLWRKRDSGEGMPRMLRWMLNNRLFAEKVDGGES